MKTGRFARDGNARASASDTTIGKPNVQNTASGSRMNSRIRASVNCTSGRPVNEVRLKPDTTGGSNEVRLKPDTTGGSREVRLKPDTTGGSTLGSLIAQMP